MARNRARFNFQRINLGNTSSTGGCESKDFSFKCQRHKLIYFAV